MSARLSTTCKLLLLTHAFETLGCAVVGLRTDNFNATSQRAIERLGAKKDGTLRHHQARRDGSARDTVMYSILRAEWPDVKERLTKRIMSSPSPEGIATVCHRKRPCWWRESNPHELAHQRIRMRACQGCGARNQLSRHHDWTMGTKGQPPRPIVLCRSATSLPINRGPDHSLEPLSLSNSSTNPFCPTNIFPRAVATSNHPARSTSGNSRPLNVNVLLLTSAASQSPRTAHACTTFPLGWTSGERGMGSPPGAESPVSSVNSRRAAASGSSSGANSPLGIDQAPSSLCAQNGPPGCTRNTSSLPAMSRNSSSPALVLGILSQPARRLST